MKRILLSGLTFCMASALLLTSCKDDEPGSTVDPGKASKYVLMTMSEVTSAKPGFTSAFDALPTGDVSNINTPNTLQGQGMGGWRPYKNWIFRMFNSSNEKGIERLNIAADGKVTTGTFIKTNNTINGSGNFVIQDDTKGFYWDGDKPWEIQTFNPTTLASTGKLAGDFETALKKTDAGITFQGIGQHLLALKGGKLYADITYSKGTGAQSGMFNDFFPDVYIAVINASTGAYEKTIKIPDTGSITYINDNEMFSIDEKGDLYIVCQGTNALGGRSKIVRIKAAETDIDATWSLNMDEINTVKGKFVSVFAKNGKIITLINNAALTGGTSGNINTGEIWEFNSVDIATKAITKITGIPAVTNPGAAYGAFELDGKTLLRVNAPSASVNGYYELNGTAATKLFGVREGGAVTGLVKIEL